MTTELLWNLSRILIRIHDWNSSRIAIRNAAVINLSGQYNYYMTPEYFNNFYQYYIGQSYCLTSQMTMEFFNNEARAHNCNLFWIFHNGLKTHIKFLIEILMKPQKSAKMTPPAPGARWFSICFLVIHWRVQFCLVSF